jgi:hypothetical protein
MGFPEKKAVVTLLSAKKNPEQFADSQGVRGNSCRVTSAAEAGDF